MIKIGGKRWAQEEINYLEEHYGCKSVKQISRKINRSAQSIRAKSYNLGLMGFFKSSDYITCAQLMAAVYGYSGASGKVSANKSLKDLPYVYKTAVKKTLKVIKIDDFWKWAELNKHSINFAKFEEGILGAEPDWAKTKRKIDREHKTKRSEWTSIDDSKLIYMLERQKHTYLEIATELNRTESSIRRRIIDLKIQYKPIMLNKKRWTNNDIGILMEMHNKGWPFDQIAVKLGRSAVSCKDKFREIRKKDLDV